MNTAPHKLERIYKIIFLKIFDVNSLILDDLINMFTLLHDCMIKT